MSESSLVSVLTPTYNHEEYIIDCIQSVLAQSYKNWEQIILNDGSNDKTGEIVFSYQNRDSRIIYISQSNRGVSHLVDNYNDILGITKGEYIAILEGDDFWPADKLDNMVSAMEAHPDVILAYGYTEVVDNRVFSASRRSWAIPGEAFVNKHKEVLNNIPIGGLTKVMLNGSVMMPVSTLIRRSALDSIGGFHTVEDGHAVDLATILELSLIGPFLFIPEILGFWRRHESQMSSSIYLDKIMKADYNYSIQFMERNAGILGLTEQERFLVRKKWERDWTGVNIRLGRSYLLQHNWKGARDQFLQVLVKRPNQPFFKYAVFGLVAALFHIDLIFFERMSFVRLWRSK